VVVRGDLVFNGFCLMLNICGLGWIGSSALRGKFGAAKLYVRYDLELELLPWE